MDNNKSIAGMKSGIESKVTTKRVQAEDGSSIETRVEEVEGGFIKTVDKRFKDDNNEWQYKCEKSVSLTNPFEEKSMADKLEEYMEGEE
jgi:hypothetical protein